MDTQTIDLVQESFAKVEPIKAQAAELFYADLFATAPEVRPLFKGNMSEQGMKLMGTLAVVVNGLKDLEKIVPAAQNLAVKHVDYGVKPEHYAKVGASLLAALEQGLGNDFTPEVKAAWTDAYTVLSGVMIEAAYPA